MLGKELKDKRIKSGLTLNELGKLLECSPTYVDRLENGVYPLTKKLIKRINNVISEEYTLGITNKKFSREKFLKDMLTGNSVIDDIYINANWLKNMDNKPIYTRGSQKDTNSITYKATRVRQAQKQYVILDTNLFYCKEQWLDD